MQYLHQVLSINTHNIGLICFNIAHYAPLHVMKTQKAIDEMIVSVYESAQKEHSKVYLTSISITSSQALKTNNYERPLSSKLNFICTKQLKSTNCRTDTYLSFKDSRTTLLRSIFAAENKESQKGSAPHCGADHITKVKTQNTK